MRCRFFIMKLDQKTCRADAKLSRPDHDVISRESFSHLWWLRSGAGDQMLIEVSHKGSCYGDFANDVKSIFVSKSSRQTC